MAIMQLVEAGKIDLDTPIQKYLPWFALADPEEAKQITIRHLISHTSGISELTGNKDIFSDDMQDDALENGIRELSNTRLNRPVGESYEYSNINYAILGLIVQVVSGQSYESYIKEHIFTPLEMSNSYTSKAEASGLATGHTFFFGNPIVRDNFSYSRRLLPAGFLISSAEDLGHY
ncbi:serine hydrolase domain-containing protein, partial [Thermodesulfobacteriota bacterium]